MRVRRPARVFMGLVLATIATALHGEVTAVDGRRITYRVWAEDEDEKVAEGTHERYVINVGRFSERVIAKARGGTTPRP